MRLPVYRGTDCVGTLEAERDGLYWRLNAVCTGEPLERLWLHTASHRRCLGPLTPENGLLACRGRVSCAELGGEAITHAVVQGASPWQLQQNVSILGKQFETALFDGARYAIAFDPSEAFPLPGAFCLCSIERIDGMWYVIVKDDGQSTPSYAP